MVVKRVDYAAKNAAQEFVTSLRETGFAVLYNHPISEPDTLKLYQEWEQQFFDLPVAQKNHPVIVMLE